MCQELMWALSICIRNWCVRWVYGSGAGACTENKRQELMIKVNACMKFEKVPSKLAEHISQELIRLWAYASVSYVYAQHKRKNSKFKKSLQNMLSLRIRNWCICSESYQFLTYMLSMFWRDLFKFHTCIHAQHKRKNSNFKKSLQNMLSLRIRNWYMQWAYTSGYDAWTEHTRP